MARKIIAPGELPKGKLQFLMTHYDRPSRANNWRDTLFIVYRDEETGEKHVHRVSEPSYRWWWMKHHPGAYRKQVPMSDVELMESPFRRLRRSMEAKLKEEEGAECSAFLRTLDGLSDYDAKGLLHKHPRFMSTDMDVQDDWIRRFQEVNPQDGLRQSLKKLFYDIEVDISDWGGFPYPEEAPCEVFMLATCLVDPGKPPVCELHVVDDRGNESQQAWLEEDGRPALRALRARVREELDPSAKVRLRIHSNERELIRAFFDYVKEQSPDYVLAWNHSFDAMTLLNRALRLDMDKDALLRPDSMDGSTEPASWRVDERAQEIADKGEWMQGPSESVWLDQMICFATLRKALAKRDSYSLDAIAQEELKAAKLQMPPGLSLKTWARGDYATFAEYNMRDVTLLARLEAKNMDVDQLHALGLLTCTRVQKAMTKTVSLRNYMRRVAEGLGIVLGNNPNAGGTGETEKFKGAWVAPQHLNGEVGIPTADGRKSTRIHDNVCDFDLASLYPSIFQALNIDVTTQVGMLRLLGPEGDPDDELTFRFCDEATSRNAESVGRRWLGLPGPEELAARAAEMLSEQRG